VNRLCQSGAAARRAAHPAIASPRHRSKGGGDLKAGNGPSNPTGYRLCDNSLYTDAVSTFNTLKAAAIFTPGGNDWTDCDRASNGGFNSRNRLDFERQIFFSTDHSLGQHPLDQEVQTLEPNAFCLNEAGTHVACVENRR
jgi:hypothetical protein